VARGSCLYRPEHRRVCLERRDAVFRAFWQWKCALREFYFGHWAKAVKNHNSSRFRRLIRS
jgi:hypothetical protein